MPERSSRVNDDAKKLMQEITERKQLYQNVFESPDGKKVLEDLSRQAFGKKTTFNENANKMAFNEGQRSIVLHINSIMTIDLKRTEDLIKKQQGGSDE